MMYEYLRHSFSLRVRCISTRSNTLVINPFVHVLGSIRVYIVNFLSKLDIGFFSRLVGLIAVDMFDAAEIDVCFIL